MGEDEGREEAPGWESQEGSPPLHTHTHTTVRHIISRAPPPPQMERFRRSVGGRRNINRCCRLQVRAKPVLQTNALQSRVSARLH